MIFPLFYIIASNFEFFGGVLMGMVGWCSPEAEVIGWCLVLTVTDRVVVRCEAATSHIGLWRYEAALDFLLLSVLCAENDLIIFTLNGNRNIDLGCWKSIKKIESMVSCEQSLIVSYTLASIPKFGVQRNSGCFKIYIYGQVVFCKF
jgi:hypothetical protein